MSGHRDCVAARLKKHNNEEIIILVYIFLLFLFYRNFNAKATMIKEIQLSFTSEFKPLANVKQVCHGFFLIQYFAK